MNRPVNSHQDFAVNFLGIKQAAAGRCGEVIAALTPPPDDSWLDLLAAVALSAARKRQKRGEQKCAATEQQSAATRVPYLKLETERIYDTANA